MADEHLDRLIDSLEATFDAGVARAEDEAASDLALSLLQDENLPDALARTGAVHALLPGGAAAPVVEVGLDYFSCGPAGDIVIPLEQGVFRVEGGGRGPHAIDRSFLELLRDQVRAAATVEITVRDASYRARIRSATADHVALSTRTTEVSSALGAEKRAEIYIPIGAIERVTLCGGGA